MISLALAQTDSGTDKIELSEVTFGREFNEALVHQVIVAGMAANRAGTKAQKNRSDVRGGGRKPWKQKGTGNARAGTITSPIWVKGGRAFAARPRDYSQKVNKKMYRGAMRSILSEIVRQDRLTVVESLSMQSHKTKDLLAKLKDFNLSGERVLIVVSKEPDVNLYLASRNLPGVVIVNSSALNPLTLVKYNKVLATVDAVKELEEVLS